MTLSRRYPAGAETRPLGLGPGPLSAWQPHPRITPWLLCPQLLPSPQVKLRPPFVSQPEATSPLEPSSAAVPRGCHSPHPPGPPWLRDKPRCSLRPDAGGQRQTRGLLVPTTHAQRAPRRPANGHRSSPGSGSVGGTGDVAPSGAAGSRRGLPVEGSAKASLGATFRGLGD